MNTNDNSQNEKLTKDVHHGKIAGVCAGLANYFSMPRLAVRLIAVLCLFSFGKFIALAYIGAALILPKR